MKRILITTILLASGLANAGSINTKILHDAFKGTPLAGIKIADAGTQPDPQPPIQPIRQAKARIRVMKQTYTQNGTQFEVKQEDVCLVNASVDIFDMRNTPNGIISLPGNATCASSVNGQPVNISIIAMGAYVDGSLFPNDPKTDYKGFGASLGIDASTAPGIDSSFVTTDLNLKSATLSLMPYTETTCTGSGCSVNHPESFNAIIEITD